MTNKKLCQMDETSEKVPKNVLISRGGAHINVTTLYRRSDGRPNGRVNGQTDGGNSMQADPTPDSSGPKFQPRTNPGFCAARRAFLDLFQRSVD